MARSFSFDADENGNAYFRSPLVNSTETAGAPEHVTLLTAPATACLPAASLHTFSSAVIAAEHQLATDFCMNSSGLNVAVSIVVFRSMPQALSVSAASLDSSASCSAWRLRISSDCAVAAEAAPRSNALITSSLRTFMSVSRVGGMNRLGKRSRVARTNNAGEACTPTLDRFASAMRRLIWINVGRMRRCILDSTGVCLLWRYRHEHPQHRRKPV